jgi:hypothetical protein
MELVTVPTFLFESETWVMKNNKIQSTNLKFLRDGRGHSQLGKTEDKTVWQELNIYLVNERTTMEKNG